MELRKVCADLDDTLFPDVDLTVPKTNEIKSFESLILKRVLNRILSTKRPLFKVLIHRSEKEPFGSS